MLLRLFLVVTVSATLSFTGKAEDFKVQEKTGAAIQCMVDAANAAGGGRVIVPAGEYPSGSLRMRSNVELHLEKGARIVGGAKSEDYFSFPLDVCRVTPEKSTRVFVYAWDAENIAITGEGVIYGQGPKFFDKSKLMWKFWAKPPCERPRMVQFVRCRGIRLQGVTFLDSPGWTMLIRLCENVNVEGIKVHADQRMINSDGIDFDGCRNVRVSNSDFRTGDDCLIMRAMREKGSDETIICENVEVSDCTLDSACQCIRMGCPSDDTIRNIVFRNISMKGRNGIYFNYPRRYLSTGNNGLMDIRDVLFENFVGDCSDSAIQIDVEKGIKLRSVKDITFRNFNVKSARPVRFAENELTRFENIKLDNVLVNGVLQK